MRRRPAARASRGQAAPRSPGPRRARRPGSPSAAARSIPRPSVSGSAAGNSSTPLGHMKALNPTTPALGQGVEAVAVARHQPAPEGEVDPGAPTGRGDLRVEGGGVQRRGEGVQRHVERAGRPRRRRARACPCRSPPSSARPGVVQVHVGVDRAGHHQVAARVDLLGARRAARGRPRPPRRPPRRRPMRRRAPRGRGSRRRLQAQPHDRGDLVDRGRAAPRRRRSPGAARRPRGSPPRSRPRTQITKGKPKRAR